VLKNKFDLTVNFELIINFDFFDLMTWESLMMSVKFCLWAFHKLQKQVENLTFGCPAHHHHAAATNAPTGPR